MPKRLERTPEKERRAQLPSFWRAKLWRETRIALNGWAGKVPRTKLIFRYYVRSSKSVRMKGAKCTF